MPGSEEPKERIAPSARGHSDMGLIVASLEVQKPVERGPASHSFRIGARDEPLSEAWHSVDERLRDGLPGDVFSSEKRLRKAGALSWGEEFIAESDGMSAVTVDDGASALRESGIVSGLFKAVEIDPGLARACVQRMDEDPLPRIVRFELHFQVGCDSERAEASRNMLEKLGASLAEQWRAANGFTVRREQGEGAY